MVLRVDVVEAALRARYGARPGDAAPAAPRDRADAGRARCSTTRSSMSWRAEPALTLLSGRYEGFDERVLEHFVSDRVSIGRYVLAGGELAAMVVCDAVLRKLPGCARPRALGARGVVQRGARRRARVSRTTRGRPSSAAGRCPTCCSPATTRGSATGGWQSAARAQGSGHRAEAPQRSATIGRPRAGHARQCAAPRRRPSPVPRRQYCHEHRDRQPGARSAPPRTGVRRRRPAARPLPGDRGHPAADPGVRGHRDQAPGSRRPGDVHGPQAVVRRRRRADVPAAFAEDRADRGRRARRRAARQALLPARSRRQARPRPRAPQRPAPRRRSSASCCTGPRTTATSRRGADGRARADEAAEPAAEAERRDRRRREAEDAEAARSTPRSRRQSASPTAAAGRRSGGRRGAPPAKTRCDAQARSRCRAR